MAAITAHSAGIWGAAAKQHSCRREQHLRLLRDKGAVRAEREGQRVYYSIADPRFVQGVKLIHDALLAELRRRAGKAEPPGAAEPAPAAETPETAET